MATAPVTGSNPEVGLREPIVLNRPFENVCIRILKSPLTWAVGDTSILVTASIMVFTGAAALNPLSIITITVASVALGVLVFTKTSIIWRDGSLLALRIETLTTRFLNRMCCARVKEQRWHDRIVLPWNPEKHLYLSALPLATMNHHIEILKCNQGHGVAVLSATMCEENCQAGLMGDPVSPTDWQALGVDHHQEEIVDLHIGMPTQLVNGSDFIHRSLSSRKVTLVHCKAGRQRSAKMILTYLLRYEQVGLKTCRNGDEPLVETAIRIVKASRPRTFIIERDKAEVDRALVSTV